MQTDEARTLIDSIDTTFLPSQRDRALIGLMVYTFACVGGAAILMRVEDFYMQRRSSRDSCILYPCDQGSTILLGYTVCS